MASETLDPSAITHGWWAQTWSSRAGLPAHLCVTWKAVFSHVLCRAPHCPPSSNITGIWRSPVLPTVAHWPWMSIVAIMRSSGCFSDMWSWAGSCTVKAANVLEGKKWRPFPSRRISHSVLQTNCFVWHMITWYRALETVVPQRRFKGDWEPR